ncbi:MAG: DUF3108 domain-containing protein [Cytophagales bacterium]|nr:DUF3108 domain-containing protein [Bernardetiaceae bacterium]MDW8210871.1 DUF3108 domain-containing protein [Cytophagales bacterium]
MKFTGARLWILLSVAGFALVGFTPDEGYRSLPNNKFSAGEKLSYLVHYGFINVGKATVSLDEHLYTINNRACYKVDIHGKTTGLFAMTMKVNDLWRSYIDTGAIIPHKFFRHIQENDYKKVETVFFDHLKGTAQVRHTTGMEAEKVEYYKIPKNVQDIVSGYYYLRTLDFSGIKEKDTLTITGFFEDKVYDLQIIYLGKSYLQTKFGRIKAAVISPIMPENQLFRGKHPIKMWISDDDNRVPLRVEVAMLIGAFELDLIEHQGLKHPFATVRK